MKNSFLEQLKYETSSELGYINKLQDANFEFSEEIGVPSNPSNQMSIKNDYKQFLNNAKYEIAGELGIQLNEGNNAEITSRNAGRIGGRIGGKIGGNMVKKMVRYAESNMKDTNNAL